MTEFVESIALEDVINLSQLFYLRVKRTPDRIAYRYFDAAKHSWIELSWSDMAEHIARWQQALRQENLVPGDRVALMASNGPNWIMFEQAALGLGLIVVPLYTNDRADNVDYILQDAGIRILLLETAAQWQALKTHCKKHADLLRVVCLNPISDTIDGRVVEVNDWLPDNSVRYPLQELKVHKSTLATIVYTSGTTGKPKGVMLSHQNIFWDAFAGLENIHVSADDQFLSFLPVSHMLERTAGYYLPMICGCTVTFARSIETLADDLKLHKPTIIITVPRIFERVSNRINAQLAEKTSLAKRLFQYAVHIGWYRFEYRQHKKAWHVHLLLWPMLYFLIGRKVMARLGGRLRLAISGGAPLSADIARLFIGLGLTISQGYGLTEASPVISVNRLNDNDPRSVGQPLPGIEIKLGENSELLIRGPCVMMGYWQQDEATRAVIDVDGWLHTGDKVAFEDGHIYITGRLKEIMVLSNGEKVSPADLEMALCTDTLIEQALVFGEQKPYLVAILVINPEQWKILSSDLGITDNADMLNHPSVHKHIIKCVHEKIKDFPGYAKIYKIHLTLDTWTVENNLMTPTLKLKRDIIANQYAEQIEDMYHGH